MHFSSGSFDLLNCLPDGTEVEHPLEAVEQLAEQAPAHPYAKLGSDKFRELALGAAGFLDKAGVRVTGSADRNHFRITPMGTLKPTWLTLKEQAACGERGKLPWRKVALFNVTGFLDFYMQFIADEFQQMGTECVLREIAFPALERLRKNPTEMRSVNIARVFDRQENIDELARALKAGRGDCEAIAMPAITGLSRTDVLEELERQVGTKIALLPTLPPSVPGIRAQQRLRRTFEQAGGVYMLGDSALRAEQEGRRITKVYSYNHGDIPFVAENVVLATGGFFSQGLVALPGKVYEPVFGLDVEFDENRSAWYDMNVFAAQRYEAFGVKTDNEFRGLRGGTALENVYVAGAVLEGFDAIKQGCGAGVSLLSALFVAEQILSK